MSEEKSQNSPAAQSRQIAASRLASWAIPVGLVTLWFAVGGLWGWAIGDWTIGNHPRYLDDAVGILLLNRVNDINFISQYFRAFLRLIGILAIAGNSFWFLRRVSRKTEFAFLSFGVVLWIGLFVFCPLPRSLENSSWAAQGITVTDLVNTRSVYALLGDGLASTMRNYVGNLVFAVIGTISCLARVVAVLILGKRRAK